MIRTIGIIGGGQLARMTAYAAYRMGLEIAILDPEPDSPAGQIAHLKLVSSYEDIYIAGERFGWPLLLKTRRNGYDGRGNLLISESDKVLSAFDNLRRTKSPLMVEAFVPFKKELAVMVARSRNGEILSYPVVETIQKDHICHIVKVPADVGEDVSKMVATIAKQAIEAVKGE